MNQRATKGNTFYNGFFKIRNYSRRAEQDGQELPVASKVFLISLAIFAYVVYNLAFAALAAPAGILSDRLGRRRVMRLGFLIFAVVYTGFALAASPLLIWPLFAL
ncbi:MFS transporter [candidate division KSB1 bacterium]|nr:MFS transporter [candidate division KSB1 bacterium]